MSSEETKKSESETIKPMLGTRWNCRKCGLSNDMSNWQCVACFATMKTAFQDRKSQKNRRKQRKGKKNEEITKKRQEKRNKVYGDDKDKNDDDDDNKNDFENDNNDKTDGDISTEVTYQSAYTIPKIMVALVKEDAKKGYVFKDDYKVPLPEEDELLIKSFSVAICGSDLMLYEWTKEAEQIAKLPFIPGHESAGLIVAKGSRCRMRLGERVAIENHFFCGECYQCKDKRRDICANLKQFGHGKGTIYGGCCEYFTVKERYCYRLRTNISWRDAALLEPLGVAHNACDRLEINSKETVLIIGCGSIGCMAISVAKSMGAPCVIACDIIDNKLDIASKMGADIVFNSSKLDEIGLKEKILSLTNGVGVGRLIECSGNSNMLNSCFSLVRKGGNVVLVGLPKSPLNVENVLQDIIFKSIQIRSIHGRRIFQTWRATEKLISDKKVNLDYIVNESLSLKEFETGYSDLKSGKALKVVFDLTK